MQAKNGLQKEPNCKETGMRSIYFMHDLGCHIALVTPFDIRPQIIEYAGSGASHQDVGFAQAAQPLSPSAHYFELEILEQGESCFIAIGVAHKHYPVKQHPGWTKGSIAYHADDGTIFIGALCALCALCTFSGGRFPRGDRRPMKKQPDAVSEVSSTNFVLACKLQRTARARIVARFARKAIEWAVEFCSQSTWRRLSWRLSRIRRRSVSPYRNGSSCCSGERD